MTDKVSREINDNALNIEEALKNENVKLYSTGASAVADKFNSLVSKIESKADKEKDKPKYRFLKNDKDDRDYIGKLSEAYEILKEIQNNLDKWCYTVKVFEDLDSENVDKESRYYIRISKFDKIYSKIELVEYVNHIKDFEFDEETYIENIICKIEGYSSEKTKIIAGYIVEYISNLIYFKELYYLTYSIIGWEHYYEGIDTWIFKYDEIYSKVFCLRGEIKKNYAYGLNCSDSNMLSTNKDILTDIIKECIPNFKIDTGYELSDNIAKKIKEELYKFNDYKWVITTRDLISNHAYCALILGAGISGLLRQLLPYTKETNININIFGKPASGKSTISHYLLGIFGNPEVLEGSFIDTDNSIEFTRAKRPILPYVLDERMLKNEVTSENVKKQKMFMDIFREYEGKVKERLGTQYEEMSGKRTYGPVISSSVNSIMDILYTFENNVGQYRRFIELNIEDRNKKLLFSNAEEAERAEKIAYNCYGYGVRIIVDYMLYILNKNNDTKDVTCLTQRFDEVNIKIKDKLKEKEENKKVGDLTSSSKRFALIVLSYQILKEALEFYIDNFYDINDSENENYISVMRALEIDEDNKNGEIKDLSDEIIEILVENLIQKMRHLKVFKNKNDKALYNYILSNPRHFIEVNSIKKEEKIKLSESKGNILGYYILKDDYMELWTVYDYQLDVFWYMESIPRPEEIKEYIEYVEEQKINSGEKYSIQENLRYAKERYNAIPAHAQEKEGRTNIKMPNDTTVYFSKKNIKIDRIQVNEEEEA